MFVTKVQVNGHEGVIRVYAETYDKNYWLALNKVFNQFDVDIVDMNIEPRLNALDFEGAVPTETEMSFVITAHLKIERPLENKHLYETAYDVYKRPRDFGV